MTNMTSRNNILVLNRERNDRQNACQNCMRRSQCPVFELSSSRLEEFARNSVVQKTTRQNQYIFNAGDKFDGIYMVRSGFFKSYFIDTEGEMQVTGFHFPGEMFGIDGIETGFYSNTVEALDTGSICKIPFSLFTQMQGAETYRGSSGVSERKQYYPQQNQLMLSLVKIMSKVISRDRGLIFALGKMSARQRFATFLMDISQRMEASGFSKHEMRLCMSRIDMANYLGLAVETVSRLFTLFQTMGVLDISRRDLKIFDMDALQAIVNGEDRDEILLDKAS